MMTDETQEQTFASVWVALEDSPAEAANMRLRSDLMIALQEVVAGWGLTQAEAAHASGGGCRHSWREVCREGSRER